MAELRRRLLAWYGRHGRDLPWRRTRDPYRVLVAETMLQQTRVDTVLPYYERFLAAFPDVRSLAAAPRPAVLRLWEGLGYYRRAENLHRLAAVLVDRHGGEVPRTKAALLALPGVGPYTAAAVRVFAFEEVDAPVDGNLRRLFARLAPGVDPHALTGALAQAEPFAVVQALMDLAATVCRPRRPRCACCPWAELCATQGEGERPAPRARRPVVDVAMYVVAAGDRLLAGRRPPGLLGGLFGLPTVPEVDLDPLVLAAVHEVGRFRHEFSHRIWAVTVRRATYVDGPLPSGFAFWPREALSALPFGRPFRRALALAGWTDEGLAGPPADAVQ